MGRRGERSRCTVGTQVQLPLCLPHVDSCAHSCTFPVSTSFSPSLPDTHVDGVQSQELYSLKFWVWLWAERTSYGSWWFIELITPRKTKSNIYSLRYILFFLKECFLPLLWNLKFCALDISSKWTPSKRLCYTGCIVTSLQMYSC